MPRLRPCLRLLQTPRSAVSPGRWRTAMVVVVVLVGLPTTSACWPVTQAVNPPRIAEGNVIFDSNRTGNYEIFTMPGDGSTWTQLTSDPAWDSWWAKLSPDRTTILFYRTPAGVHDSDYTKTSLWTMAADGSNLRLLRPAGTDGWTYQGHGDFSPSGTKIVMFGGSASNPQIWTTGLDGTNPVALTNRPGQNLDPAWAEDGSIVFISCPTWDCRRRSFEVYRLPAGGGDPVRLTDDGYQDQDPHLSPDGSTIALLTRLTWNPDLWDIRVGPVGQPPHRLVGDDNINSKPNWTRDGQSILFHRAVAGSVRGFQVWAVSPDGTNLRCLTTLQPGQNEYPS
jgi:Tol biopolymer transport system component